MLRRYYNQCDGDYMKCTSYRLRTLTDVGSTLEQLIQNVECNAQELKDFSRKEAKWAKVPGGEGYNVELAPAGLLDGAQSIPLNSSPTTACSFQAHANGAAH
jgi:hypothetical protein